MLNKSLFSSDKEDWETPRALFSALDAEFSFDLDPCCSPENAKCGRRFTKAEDGLSQPWTGTVFVNPPYARTIQMRIEKAHRESLENGATVVCLVPARTDTRWWHRHCVTTPGPEGPGFCRRSPHPRRFRTFVTGVPQAVA
jgi:phage N-6-adenine-methyltransferase